VTEKPAAAALPVMLWIHGGGFVNGGSHARRPGRQARPVARLDLVEKAAAAPRTGC